MAAVRGEERKVPCQVRRGEEGMEVGRERIVLCQRREGKMKERRGRCQGRREEG